MQSEAEAIFKRCIDREINTLFVLPTPEIRDRFLKEVSVCLVSHVAPSLRAYAVRHEVLRRVQRGARRSVQRRGGEGLRETE